MDRKKTIELRSEKVRNIIGKIPSVLVRYGALLIGVALLIFVAIAAFIPYRETIPVKIILKMVPEAEYVAAEKSSIVIIKEIKEALSNDSDAVFEGKIILNVKNGSYIPEGDTLFAVLPRDHLVFGIAQIHQSNLAKVKPGNRVLINDAVTGYMEGKVEQISPIPIKNNPSLRKVRIVFDEKTEWNKLIPNSQPEGKIILSDTPVLKKILESVGISY